MPVVVPAVQESQLVHDPHGPTRLNGAFMVYERCKMQKTN